MFFRRNAATTRALIALTLGVASGGGAVGCSSSGARCTEWDDMTGRPVAYCDDERSDPVCDLPGEEARFEDMGAFGWVLVGGVRATCSLEEREPTCPMGAEGSPYCLPDPGL